MIIHFSVKQDDYDCLIEHVAEEDGNTRSALRRATRAGQPPDGLGRMEESGLQPYWRRRDAPGCAYALSWCCFWDQIGTQFDPALIFLFRLAPPLCVFWT
jgi:hypothetical protein